VKEASCTPNFPVETFLSDDAADGDGDWAAGVLTFAWAAAAGAAPLSDAGDGAAAVPAEEVSPDGPGGTAAGAVGSDGGPADAVWVPDSGAGMMGLIDVTGGLAAGGGGGVTRCGEGSGGISVSRRFPVVSRITVSGLGGGVLSRRAGGTSIFPVEAGAGVPDGSPGAAGGVSGTGAAGAAASAEAGDDGVAGTVAGDAWAVAAGAAGAASVTGSTYTSVGPLATVVLTVSAGGAGDGSVPVGAGAADCVSNGDG